jgi:protein TonB
VCAITPHAINFYQWDGLVKKRQPKSAKFVIWTISGLVTLLFLGGALGAIKLLLSDDSGKHKRHVQMITLLKPPQPPKIKEKPPEPEVKKKEEMIEPQEEEPEPDPTDDITEDDGPTDDTLGLDADGSGGSDGFGLRAKKGGRDIIGGRFSQANLLRKYAWYTSLLQEDIRKKVRKYMEENGGIPEGNLHALVRITLDEMGRIINFDIAQPSGNETMDKALQQSILMANASQPPPTGMPLILKLKISSKG